MYPLRKSFDASQPLIRGAASIPGSAEGEGVYEIPVGPVHAGIIEPGLFRFQAVGEDVVNLEERLGYVHKGIEKRFESLPGGRGTFWPAGYPVTRRSPRPSAIAWRSSR